MQIRGHRGDLLAVNINDNGTVDLIITGPRGGYMTGIRIDGYQGHMLADHLKGAEVRTDETVGG